MSCSICKATNKSTCFALTRFATPLPREFGKSTAPIVKSLIIWGSFNKRKITKIIDEDELVFSESSFLQDRVIDLFHDEIRLKNLQRKK